MKKGGTYLLLAVLLTLLMCVAGCGGGGGGGSDSSGSGTINSPTVSGGGQAVASNATVNEDSKGNTYDTPEPATLSMVVVGIAGVCSYVVVRKRRRS